VFFLRVSFTLSSLSVCKHSLEESTLEAASGQVSTQEDEHTQTPPSPRCLGPSARLMGTLYVFVLAATVSVVYTVLFRPGGGSFLIWQGRKHCKIVHFRATEWNCWAGECFQVSCASEGWSVGEAAQGMVNVIYSVMRNQRNVNWHSKENKLSLTGKNDGEGGSFVNFSSVFWVCHLLF